MCSEAFSKSFSIFHVCVLNMHWICCAKNFEINMRFNQTIVMFVSEEVTHYLNVNAEYILRTPCTWESVQF